MDDILLSDSNANTLERIFEEVKTILTCWELQIVPEKTQRGDYINYLGYKICVPQKVQINRDRWQTFNDFQRLLGDISHLWCFTGIKPDELIHLNNTLDGDKDLNSPRELSAEAERELALIEEKLQNTHVDCVDLNHNCIWSYHPPNIPV